MTLQKRSKVIIITLGSSIKKINFQLGEQTNWVVPENIHTSPTEEIPAIQGGGREMRNVLRCPEGREGAHLSKGFITLPRGLSKGLHFVKDHCS